MKMGSNGRARNMKLVGHSTLNGFGNGGEGISLKTLPGGRRILFIAHEGPPKDFTVLDVTDPSNPKVVTQVDLPHNRIRSNSLALVDDLMVVAYQGGLDPNPSNFNLEHAGVAVWDVSNVEKPKEIGFFKTSGNRSRGAHFVWFVDGRYAHISTGMPDSHPTHPNDDQFYVTLDLADPARPREVGRWWLPGTQEGDAAAPPSRHRPFDVGFRAHNINVYPERPDRAYVGYIDGGVIILDISDKAHPRMISRVDYHPPFPGFTHTVLPLFKRDLLIATDECVQFDLKDWPKRIWVLDAREETNPVIISSFPTPPKEQFLFKGARLGAHNIHENEPLSTSWFSDTIIIGTFFSGGVVAYDISDPFRPEEVAYYIPPAPEGCVSTMINDLYVDERGLIYALDRVKGGLYILEMNL
jgi:hypothetical protein